MQFLILYTIDSLLHLIALQTNLLWLVYITKVLLMPLLMLYLWKQLKFDKSAHFVYAALFFSWLGDIFLMFPRSEYSASTKQLLFILGLSSFLIAHISYIISFIKEIKPNIRASITVRKPYLLLPFFVYLYSMLNFLFPYLGAMKIPVVVYAVCITTMLLAAFSRMHVVRRDSFYFVFVGAMFFLISDTVLSIQIFYIPLPYSRVIVMLTYIIAQLLIVYGTILQHKKKV